MTSPTTALRLFNIEPSYPPHVDQFDIVDGDGATLAWRLSADDAERVVAALAERDRRIGELGEVVAEGRSILSAFGPAAFNILWCAINWNDHNFKEEVLRQKGKRAAELLGFSRSAGVEPVNEWIDRMEKWLDADALSPPPAVKPPAVTPPSEKEGA